MTTTVNLATGKAAAAPAPRVPKPPLPDYTRQFNLCDGRRIRIDKRAVSMICEALVDKHGPGACIVAFKNGAGPVPVREDYDVLSAWWRGAPSNGKVAP
jgi:hypothetical protein